MLDVDNPQLFGLVVARLRPKLITNAPIELVGLGKGLTVAP